METPEWIVRDYTEADFPAVMELWESTSLSNKARGDNADTIHETLKLGGRMLLLFVGETLAGTSWITTDGRRLYLHHFGIHPDFQGKGLSKPLLEDSLSIAKELNMQIKLEVHRTNKAAIALYARYGFGYLGDYDVYIIRDPQSI